MIVTPIPGASRDNILTVLRGLSTSAKNLDGQQYDSAYERLLPYLEWANESQRMLAGQVCTRDIDRLIRTRMYQSLLDGVGHLAGSNPWDPTTPTPEQAAATCHDSAWSRRPSGPISSVGAGSCGVGAREQPRLWGWHLPPGRSLCRVIADHPPRAQPLPGR